MSSFDLKNVVISKEHTIHLTKMRGLTNSVLLIYLALAVTTLVVFWPLRNFDFVNYDDTAYVSENTLVQSGLTREGIIWAFTTNCLSNWHPLTWLSYMLDCQLFGTNPGAHHMINLLLHIANTLLLFALLKGMTGAIWRSVFVAAAFALHPLHIESVAWISERKDVLSTLFWMLTMGAYVYYVSRPSISRYTLTLLTFALGLMAKPMLVTLPLVLLLLDFWPLHRFRYEQNVKYAGQCKSAKAKSQLQTIYHLVIEKIPFFILSAISSIITFLFQQRSGAMLKLNHLSLGLRVINASFSYLRYIGKMFWPSRLAVFYPYHADKPPMWQAVVAALLLLALSILIIRLAARYKYLPVGWFWYLVTLIPVIGLIQVGEQAFADRYTYIPLIGLFIIIAWGLPDMLAKWRYRNIALGISMPIIILALAICTSLQLRYWRNSITLFEHTLDVTKDNYLAHFSLAKPLYEQGRFEESLAHSSEVLRLKPNHTLAHYGHALTLIKQGNYDQAITHLARATKLRPDFADAHYKLGTILQQQGKIEQAIQHYRQVLKYKPNNVAVYNNLKDLLAIQEKSIIENKTPE